MRMRNLWRKNGKLGMFTVSSKTGRVFGFRKELSQEPSVLGHGFIFSRSSSQAFSLSSSKAAWIKSSDSCTLSKSTWSSSLRYGARFTRTMA